MKVIQLSFFHSHPFLQLQIVIDSLQKEKQNKLSSIIQTPESILLLPLL